MRHIMNKLPLPRAQTLLGPVFGAAIAALALGPLAPQVSAITEPATVFYGKVTATGSARPFLLTEGTLQWSVQAADGREIRLETILKPLNDGAFSYRLDVPHQILAAGLAAADNAVTVRKVADTHTHLSITVDGVTAAPADPSPSASTFTTIQDVRAPTYRLDLSVPIAGSDQDGDTLPDWWEDQYGLGDGDDRDGDLDGDLISNLDEYLAGTDPTYDNRAPTIATTEATVFEGGMSALPIAAVDSDSSSADLRYTVTGLPAAGSLVLRNSAPDPSAPDAELAVGSTFTQADIEAGRLVYRHEANDDSPGSLRLQLHDGTAEHVASEGAVELRLFTPSEAAQTSGLGAMKFAAAGMVRDDGFIGWDASAWVDEAAVAAPSAGMTSISYLAQYRPSFGEDRPHALIGGEGADRVDGGMAGDFIAGRGGDDVLSGGGGSDRFVIDSPASGHDRITDFFLAEGDVVDVSAALSGTSPYLRDYVRIESAGEEVTLRFDHDGQGGSYDSFAVTFRGAFENLAALAQSGSLETGGLQVTPIVAIALNPVPAQETGLVSGRFTLTRVGSLDADLPVSFTVSGSATEGVDYASVGTTATFAPGEATADIVILPFADGLSEANETVQIQLSTSELYELVAGAQPSATIQIEDLKSVISIEALEPLATLDPMRPGVIAISRDGLTGQTLLVRLRIDGSAAAGSDFAAAPRFINFGVGEAVRLVEITPLAGASLTDGAKTVEVSLVSDPAYVDGGVTAVRVTLAQEETSLTAWRDEQSPGASGDLSEFAMAEAGTSGISNLLAYAFGIDAGDGDRSRFPHVWMAGGHLAIRFGIRPNAPDLSFTIETSPDGSTWISDPAMVREFFPPGVAGNAGMRAFRAVAPAGMTSTQFMRVRVNRN